MHRRRHAHVPGCVSVNEVLEWLRGLPPAALYAALALSAATENIFPPFPADTVVAFGSFLAAHGEATVLGAFLSTWLGNVAGAMGVYALGRRFGSTGVVASLERRAGAGARERIERLYREHGMVALFVSRFLPGLRALVPPVAGAMRTPAPRAALVIGGASAIWYGVITYLAYRLGSSWDRVQHAMTSLSRGALIAAGVVIALAVGAWLVYRRRHRHA